jgi:hypothetical protein
MSTLGSVLDQFGAAGRPDPGQLETSGRIVRYGSKKRAWYRLREIATRSGVPVVVGHFGFWGRVESTRIQTDWKGLGAEERRIFAEKQRQEVERARRERRARMAALRARSLWASISASGHSPYLEHKQVRGESIRYPCLSQLQVIAASRMSWFHARTGWSRQHAGWCAGQKCRSAAARSIFLRHSVYVVDEAPQYIVKGEFGRPRWPTGHLFAVSAPSCRMAHN